MRGLNRSKVAGGFMIGLIALVALWMVKDLTAMMLRPDPPQIGEAAPEFSLPKLDGATARLSDYAGDVVLLEFWTSSCVGCIGATPKLNRLHERYRGAGFAVVSVNMDGDGGAEAAEVAKRRALRYPVLLDPGAVADRYGIYATPTAILLDAEGVVRAVHKGNVTERRLDQQIQALLERRDG